MPIVSVRSRRRNVLVLALTTTRSALNFLLNLPLKDRLCAHPHSLTVLRVAIPQRVRYPT